MTVTAVTVDTFDIDVIKASYEKPVLVEFWATWCAPCRMVAPILEQMSKDYASRLTIVKIDADENVKILEQFGVANVPTMILLAGGSVVKRIHGAKPRPALEVELEPWLKG